MSKSDVLSSLNYKKNQLYSYEKELADLKEKYDVIEDFGLKCTSHINAFDSSINRRKNKLSGIERLVGAVNSAFNYMNRMNDMLTGKEYLNTVASIDQLQNTIANEKRKIVSNIEYTEDKISTLKSQISYLQYEYDNYLEEEIVSGK